MKVIRNFIEYYGVANYIPCDVLGFNDFIVEKVIKLEDKPKIDYFTKCNAKIIITKTKVIRREEENDFYKINIEGNLQSRSEYVSLEYDSLICTDRKKIDFNIDVDILEKFDVCKKIITNVFIEDIYLKKYDETKYIISFSILGIVEE